MDCKEVRELLWQKDLYKTNPTLNEECAKHVLECKSCFEWITSLTHQTVKNFFAGKDTKDRRNYKE